MTATPPASGRTSQVRDAAQPVRVDGYAQLRDYAVIGDGRCAALIARDGSVDWLAWPDLDSPSLFAAVLDPVRGGRFLLQPDVPYTAVRRYLPGTNVLETTFTTAHGTVRLTDALTLPDNASLAPGRELVRRIEGLAGSVPMRWSVQPRFDYGTQAPHLTHRAGVPVAAFGPDAVAVCAWNAGSPQLTGDAVASSFRSEAGTPAVVALAYAHQEPLVLPTRDRVRGPPGSHHRHLAPMERRTAPIPGHGARRSCAAPSPSSCWCSPPRARSPRPRPPPCPRRWVGNATGTTASAGSGTPPSPWTPSCKLGCAPEATSYFWWLMHASQLTHPRLNVLYRLNGGTRAPEQVPPPVRATGARRPCGSATLPLASFSSTPTGNCCRPPGCTPQQATGSTPTSPADWPRPPTSSAPHGSSLTPASGRSAAHPSTSPSPR